MVAAVNHLAAVVPPHWRSNPMTKSLGPAATVTGMNFYASRATPARSSRLPASCSRSAVSTSANGAQAGAGANWSEAVRVRPALGEGWNNLAVVYMQSGRKSLAQDAVKHAERAGFRVNPRLKDDIARLPKPKPQGLIERSQQSY